MVTTQPGSGTETARQAELGDFLKARRALRPEDVGLPPGPRRRTPGLRREEVALLAGVGVSWYTWLEQGRPINASAQVLDAVARTLQLDGAERWHLYRLAEALPLRSWGRTAVVPDALCDVLRSLDPLPAVLINGRFDIIETNDAHEEMFWDWHTPAVRPQEPAVVHAHRAARPRAAPQLRRRDPAPGRPASRCLRPAHRRS